MKSEGGEGEEEEAPKHMDPLVLTPTFNVVSTMFRD
jgi:hypothetical protein